MAYARRDVVGGAIATTLSAGITSGDMTFVIASATGWPTGSNGDFFVVLDRGNAGEEKVRCASRTGTTCTVQTSGRGSDGTSAAAHTSGVAAEHCLTALDLDEANYAVAKTVGLVAAQGDLLVGSAANTLVKLAKGTSGLPLVAGASTVSYTTLAAGALASDAVTTAKILDANVTLAKIASEVWSGWTPTITSSSGTITTVGAAGGRYIRIGRAVHYYANVTITTNGTGATSIIFTLPVAASASASGYIGAGYSSGVTKMMIANVQDTTHGFLIDYDGTYPGASGALLNFGGTYEAAA